MVGKLAEEQDFDFYYKLKCDKENVYWSGHSNIPDKEKLREWYLTNIKRNDRFFFIFFNGEIAEDVIGYLYLDLVKGKSDLIDNGYGVYSAHTGKGYGTKILKYGIDYAKVHLPEIIYSQCWIMTDNIGSNSMVKKLGYQKIDESKVITIADGFEKVLEKYLLKIK